MFKAGPQGVGYYKDEPAKRMARAKRAAEKKRQADAAKRAMFAPLETPPEATIDLATLNSARPMCHDTLQAAVSLFRLCDYENFYPLHACVIATQPARKATQATRARSFCAAFPNTCFVESGSCAPDPK